jgi:uncharacterized protein (TIGR04222 family)
VARLSHTQAMGDTWGISGPTFLRAYLVVGAIVLIGTLVLRRHVFGGASASGSVSPEQAAYLNGGRRLAVYAALGGLRTAGAIDLDGSRRLRQAGPMPAGSTALDQAVYNAVGQRPRDLVGDRWVADALQRIRYDLERAGLLTTVDKRRAASAGPLVLLALFAVGVARLVAGIANDKPVGYLVLTLIVLGVVTAVLLIRRPTRTRAGNEVLQALRASNRHLAPSQYPAWSTYGPDRAAMGVALYGTGALWAADPAFASAANVRRQVADAGYHGGGGSSCGGGSCGGGCGGGGCGG